MVNIWLPCILSLMKIEIYVYQANTILLSVSKLQHRLSKPGFFFLGIIDKLSHVSFMLVLMWHFLLLLLHLSVCFSFNFFNLMKHFPSLFLADSSPSKTTAKGSDNPTSCRPGAESWISHSTLIPQNPTCWAQAYSQ